MNEIDLRDQFAMAAMQSILNNRDISKKELPAIADAAYCMAEAMINERDRRNLARAQANPHHSQSSYFGMAGFLGKR